MGQAPLGVTGAVWDSSFGNQNGALLGHELCPKVFIWLLDAHIRACMGCGINNALISTLGWQLESLNHPLEIEIDHPLEIEIDLALGQDEASLPLPQPHVQRPLHWKHSERQGQSGSSCGHFGKHHHQKEGL